MIKKLSKFADFRSGEVKSAEKKRHEVSLEAAAWVAITDLLKVTEGEQVLIVSNPRPDVAAIAEALYDACFSVGGRPVLLFQPVKTQLDFAEPAVLAAFNAKPEVFISLSEDRLGKDPVGIASPYEHDGVKYDHILNLNIYGEKNCRAFWSPSVTAECFTRTIPIDYAELRYRCVEIKEILDEAAEVRVTAPGGTDMVVGLRGRTAKTDDGNFSTPGAGGNLPAGETYISPENGTSRGRICFDGSISTNEGDIVIKTPIECAVENGFMREISGGEEAGALLRTIEAAERNAVLFEHEGKLPAGGGELYARNARNIGEFGIGLNPEARITGRMLEDEKAFGTCHFAIGLNYDEDAPSLIHLDGLIKDPTITAVLPDGTGKIITRP
jgi:leucyl aminopeptidase (aminopeptidase T)